MRVEVDGKTYLVEWSHLQDAPGAKVDRSEWPPPPAGLREVPPDREGTVCLIRDGNSPSPGDGTFPVIAVGVSVVHPKDHFSKESGRRVALAHALHQLAHDLFPYPTIPDGAPTQPQRKRVRTLFWDAYHSRPGGVAIFKPEVAVAAVHDWVMQQCAILPEPSRSLMTEMFGALGEILAEAAKGRIHPDVLTKTASSGR